MHLRLPPKASVISAILDWLSYLGGLYIAYVLLEAFVSGFIFAIRNRRRK